MALGVGIIRMGPANPFNLVQQGPILQDGSAQFGPIPPSTARDHVVDGSQRVSLMIEMTVLHDVSDFPL